MLGSPAPAHTLLSKDIEIIAYCQAFCSELSMSAASNRSLTRHRGWHILR